MAVVGDIVDFRAAPVVDRELLQWQLAAEQHRPLVRALDGAHEPHGAQGRAAELGCNFTRGFAARVAQRCAVVREHRLAVDRVGGPAKHGA